MAETLHLALSADPSEAKRLRNQLHAWLLGAGINGSTGAEMVLAANEAFVNAVEHPRHRRSGEIVIRGHVDERWWCGSAMMVDGRKRPIRAAITLDSC
jgi:anti-sigma regulatory factor (Ser/Thr protein kinase)